MSDYTLFPSIIPDGDDDFVDNSYTEEDLNRMDGNELQSLAAKHPSEEINGRTKAEEIKEFLVGKERL